MLTDTSRWSHARGNEVVPSRWQATAVRATTRCSSTGQQPSVLLTFVLWAWHEEMAAFKAVG
jgi:hypothetical protein